MIIDFMLAIVGIWWAMVALSLIAGSLRKAPIAQSPRYDLTDFQGNRFKHRI